MRERLIDLAKRASIEGFDDLAKELHWIAENANLWTVENLIYNVFDNKV